jgi:hypothetical protein
MSEMFYISMDLCMLRAICNLETGWLEIQQEDKIRAIKES